jgi:hypothetical protein
MAITINDLNCGKTGKEPGMKESEMRGIMAKNKDKGKDKKKKKPKTNKK